MSTELAVIKNTGKKGNTDLTVTSFYGHKGIMVQLTQGFGGALDSNVDEPGFIQLSMVDSYKVAIELLKFVKEQSKVRAKNLDDEIAKNESLRDTIIKDAVDCEHFINDLKLLEVPVWLLGDDGKCIL